MRRSGRFRRDQPVLQTLVIAFPVIVLREGDERAAEVPLAEDHQPVQALLFDRSDEPLRGAFASKLPCGLQNCTVRTAIRNSKNEYGAG